MELLQFIYTPPINFDSEKFQPLNEKDKEYILQSLKFGCRSDRNNDPKLLKQFRKIDLNNDGKRDLVYLEACPYLETHIYLQTDHGTYSFLNKYSVMVDLQITPDSTTIIFKSEACCCIDINLLRKIVIEKGSYEIKKLTSLYWHSELELPPLNDFKDNLPSIKFPQKTALRTNLIENDQLEKDPCLDDVFYQGNLIGKLRNPTHLKPICKKLDAEKNEWQLVISNKENLHSSNRMLAYIEEDLNYFILGWIKHTTD